MAITIPQDQIIWHSGPLQQQEEPTLPAAYALIRSGDLFYPARQLSKDASALTSPTEVEGGTYEPFLATAHTHLAGYAGIETTSEGYLASAHIHPSFRALEVIVEALTEKDTDDEMTCTQYILDQIYDAFVRFSFDTARETLQEKDRLACHLYVDARYKDALNANSWWFTPDGQEADIIYVRTQGSNCTLASTLIGGAALMTYRTPASLIPYQERSEIAYGARLFLADFTSFGSDSTAYYGYIPEQETMICAQPHAFGAVEGLKRWSVEYWQKKYARLLRGKENQGRPIEELDYAIMPWHTY